MKILFSGKKDYNDYLEKMKNRLSLDSAEEGAVRDIIAGVRQRGDEAICGYVKRFDGVDMRPSSFLMTKKEWDAGIKGLDRKLEKIIDLVAERLEDFYSRNVQKSWSFKDEYGNLLGNKVVPLQRVLVYAPGGKAVYPSSVLMGAVPAKTAGVDEIFLATPMKKEGIAASVLYAAKRAGIKKIYKIGGAQAIAGFSFGTASIPKVDKIVGPGNIYVALAKKLLYGVVDIDMVAGPSEVLVILDKTADTDHVALDMLSQLEHDEQAIAVAVTDSPEAAGRLQKIIKNKAARSRRREIIEKSLNNSAILVVGDMKEAVEAANLFAPEHLEIVTQSPKSLLPFIRNAGAVFLGANTPEAVGDYIAGPNHILPTGGTARFFSPLGVESFLRRMSVISFTGKGLKALGPKVVDFAETEGLFAHGDSVRARLGKKDGSPKGNRKKNTPSS